MPWSVMEVQRRRKRKRSCVATCRIPLRQSSCSRTQSVRSRWVRFSFRFSLCPCCKLRLGPCCCKLRLARPRSDWWIGSLVEPRPRFKPENEEQPARLRLVMFGHLANSSVTPSLFTWRQPCTSSCSRAGQCRPTSARPWSERLEHEATNSFRTTPRPLLSLPRVAKRQLKARSASTGPCKATLVHRVGLQHKWYSLLEVRASRARVRASRRRSRWRRALSGSKRRGDGRDTKLTLCSWVERWICSLPGGCTLRYSWLPEWQWPILVRYSLPSERYSLPERQWPNPEWYSSVCSCLRGCSWAGERYAAKGTAGGRGRVTPWGQGGMEERSREGTWATTPWLGRTP